MTHKCLCSDKYSNENAVKNPHLAGLENDYLYHIALDTETMNLVEAFGDTKFVCMGGSPKKMYMFAKYIMEEIGHKLPFGTKLLDISEKGDRYSMYKVGPVISVNHGMGCPTIGILLNELIKLMYYAKCKNPVFFRLGTCGSIGSKPGTVIISEDACDGMLQKEYSIPVLGKLLTRSTELDKQLWQELKSLSLPDDEFEVISGTTMCTNDFYEGQARADGAFCDYTVEDQINYLKSLQRKNIVNIEMESTAFAAFTKAAGIKSGVICLSVQDVLEGDEISVPKEVMDKWQARPQILVARYIKQHLD
ncbi:unnamed protein product [Diabrotica balteata]|uniref:Nucleoside phosphorylase domain-containing protein n=1 Tax=Diabrotica balteata TaxID=107213 RepID=A0A9N9XGA5_DIABA|nr:unnamed protein product [Diabrotica balteata]